MNLVYLDGPAKCLSSADITESKRFSLFKKKHYTNIVGKLHYEWGYELFLLSQKCKGSWHHNSITTIYDSIGKCFNDSCQIETVFSYHFSNLWNSSDSKSLELVLDALPSDLPTLSTDQQISLLRTVTKDEIYTTLISLPECRVL